MKLAPVQPKPAGKISEAELQNAIIQYARLCGWLCAHFRPAQMRSGRWATAMQGDPGFPDLTLVRGERLVFCELKAQGRKPTPEQETWLDALRKASPYGGFDVYVWTPKHWLSGQVERILR